MNNPRLAARYAKSLLDLAVEQNVLESVHEDALGLLKSIKGSAELGNLLKSPVIKADKKLAITNTLLEGKVGKLTQLFIDLLIRKGREANLVEILNAFVEGYNKLKGINKIVLKSAMPMSEQLQQAIVGKIKNDTGWQNIQLITSVDESLIGGFVLEYESNLVDASIRRYLKDVKSQFKNNDYLFNIR